MNRPEIMESVTDEYIVPQIVKVVSLADQGLYANGSRSGESRGPGVRPANNIVLVDDNCDFVDHPPPPTFVDNQPECILGLQYGGEEDEDDDDDSLNHKFASFTLSNPCQPDDRVDFFSGRVTTSIGNSSSRTSNSNGIKGCEIINNRAVPTPMQRIISPSSYEEGDRGSNSFRERGVDGDDFGDFMFMDDDDDKPCGTVPFTNFWDFNFCMAIVSSLGSDCRLPANRKCAQCKNAFYCSEEHSALDWKRHRQECTPYRMQYVGKGAADGDVCEGGGDAEVAAAVACRSIAEGQIIFTEKPILLFPLAEPMGEYQLMNDLDLMCVVDRMNEAEEKCPCVADRPACLGCAKIMDTQCYCSDCGIPLCSYSCRLCVAHQAGECHVITSAKIQVTADTWSRCHHLLYMDVEILRALQREKYDVPMWEMMLAMKNNVRVEHYKKSDRFKLFVKHMDKLVPLSAKISGYNQDLIADVYAIISTLCYRPNVNSTVKLLFNTQPQFAHDCVPNTICYVEDEHCGEGSRMKLVTKSSVPILKGELITIDFTPSPYLPYQKRREILSNVLSITNCMCQRCQNPSVKNDLTAEIKCVDCHRGTVCPETPILWQDSVWSCRICQQEVPYIKIREIEDDCAHELSLVLSAVRQNGNVGGLLAFINKMSNVHLNPRHQIIFTAWCYCESLLRRSIIRCRTADPAHVYSDQEMEYFDIIGKYADVVLDHLDSIRPGIWIDKGIAQIHKFYASYALVCRDYQKRLIFQKEFINKVMKSLKLLQQALQCLSVYEGYNAPATVHLTQEATSTLASVKDYMARFLQLNEQNAYPVPSLAQLLNRLPV